MGGKCESRTMKTALMRFTDQATRKAEEERKANEAEHAAICTWIDTTLSDHLDAVEKENKTYAAVIDIPILPEWRGNSFYLGDRLEKILMREYGYFAEKREVKRAGEPTTLALFICWDMRLDRVKELNKDK